MEEAGFDAKEVGTLAGVGPQGGGGGGGDTINTGECVVIGKGNKERTVYLTEMWHYCISGYILTAEMTTV